MFRRRGKNKREEGRKEGEKKIKGEAKGGKKTREKREGFVLPLSFFAFVFFCLCLFFLSLCLSLCVFFSFFFLQGGNGSLSIFFFWILFEGGERGGARSEEKGRAASLPTWHGMCHSGRKRWGELHLFRCGMGCVTQVGRDGASCISSDVACDAQVGRDGASCISSDLAWRE